MWVFRLGFDFVGCVCVVGDTVMNCLFTCAGGFYLTVWLWSCGVGSVWLFLVSWVVLHSSFFRLVLRVWLWLLRVLLDLVWVWCLCEFQFLGLFVGRG